MKKRKIIYEQPRRYAKKCHMPMEYARRVCKWHLKFYRTVRKNNKCPYCGKRELERDWSDSEYSSETWVYCNNCDRDIDEELFPRLKVPNNSGEDFDVFLWMVHFEEIGNLQDKWWIDTIKEHMSSY